MSSDSNLDQGESQIPAVAWDIRREGRAWTTAEAEGRFALTPEKFEMWRGRLSGAIRTGWYCSGCYSRMSVPTEQCVLAVRRFGGPPSGTWADTGNSRMGSEGRSPRAAPYLVHLAPELRVRVRTERDIAGQRGPTLLRDTREVGIARLLSP